MPTQVISGISSVVYYDSTSLTTMGRWVLRNVEEARPVHASNTKQGPMITGGNTDWRAEVFGWGHTPPLWPGNTNTWIFSVDGTQGYTGPGIVEELVIDCPTMEGSDITYRYVVTGRGALTNDATAVTDETNRTIFSAIGRGVTLNAATVSQVTRWQIRFRNLARPYNNSTTGAPRNRAAGKFVADFFYEVEEGDPTQLPTLGADYTILFNVTASTYWEMVWGHITGRPTDLVADHQGDRVVNGRITGQFNGNLSTMYGWVKNPATTTLWPV